MIFSESDAGIGTAERIQAALALRGNGLCPHIRNKYLLNERARSRGLQVRSLQTIYLTIYHRYIITYFKSIQVVKQKLAYSLEDINQFLTTQMNWDLPTRLPPTTTTTTDGVRPDNTITKQQSPCVMKPYTGVASDGVYKCHNYNDILTSFHKLYNKPKVSKLMLLTYY